MRTTRGPSRRFVKIEDLERLGESDPEIMANNASHRGNLLTLYDGDNEESTGSNHQRNPTAPANQQLSNEVVSRQLAEIAWMLAQLTSQVAEIPWLHLLLKEQTLHLPPRLRGHRSTTTKPTKSSRC